MAPRFFDNLQVNPSVKMQVLRTLVFSGHQNGCGTWLCLNQIILSRWPRAHMNAYRRVTGLLQHKLTQDISTVSDRDDLIVAEAIHPVRTKLLDRVRMLV